MWQIPNVSERGGGHFVGGSREDAIAHCCWSVGTLLAAVVSKSQAKDAGKYLRDLYRARRTEADLGTEELESHQEALAIVREYRASFSQPMLGVRMGLQSFVGICGYPDAKVAQRLKRLPRIIAKLARGYPRAQLTTMQDVGGCRIVLSDLEAVRSVQQHIQNRWADRIVDLDDYIAHPPSSGYRAVHVVVLREDRMIEVQLRTEWQHRWAEEVERLGRLLGQELKSGEGPEPILRYLAVAGEALTWLDGGEPYPLEVEEELQHAREDAETYMMRHEHGSEGAET